MESWKRKSPPCDDWYPPKETLQHLDTLSKIVISLENLTELCNKQFENIKKLEEEIKKIKKQ